MGYPCIEKTHRFGCVCLFSPLEHASSMVKYLKKLEFVIKIYHYLYQNVGQKVSHSPFDYYTRYG